MLVIIVVDFIASEADANPPMPSCLARNQP
jgi:hypothetical protein